MGKTTPAALIAKLEAENKILKVRNAALTHAYASLDLRVRYVRLLLEKRRCKKMRVHEIITRALQTARGILATQAPTKAAPKSTKMQEKEQLVLYRLFNRALMALRAQRMPCTLREPVPAKLD